ncbi:MAG: zinc metallopeptidase [Butyrivibrio sp.]|nr:zinc metallopeptidase [Butyrivibrio sp.]
MDMLLYLLTVVMAVVCLIASIRVKSVYKKYAKVRGMRGFTGAMAANEILRRNGLADVQLQMVPGELTDHYDPVNKVIRLSDSVYGRDSVAAVAVAAHECGHAVQHAIGYTPIKIKNAIVPYASIGSKAGIPLILLGMFLSFSPLITIGIWVFAIAVFFELVTLPCELDASKRALAMLTEYGILAEEEVVDSRKVLSAAAMTYVASAATAVMQLLRLILMNNRRR